MSHKFEKMTKEYAIEVMDIFNYYIENSFAAYPESKLPYEFYGKFLAMTSGYPAYVIKNIDTEEVLGFCFIKAYSPLPAFKETAEVTYFIKREAHRKGIGKDALQLLEKEAIKIGVKHLLASISSVNEQSLKFHIKNGFKECGRLHSIGKKKGKNFDVVYMEKVLNTV